MPNCKASAPEGFQEQLWNGHFYNEAAETSQGFSLFSLFSLKINCWKANSRASPGTITRGPSNLSRISRRSAITCDDWEFLDDFDPVAN